MSEENAPLPVVYVLVAERFFWDKVEGTLRALEQRPVRPDWATEVFQQMLEAEPAGMVADLENDRVDVLTLIAQMRQNDAMRELPILAYCSHQCHDLIEAADGLGAHVVPRSTFAANLVRLLMDLCRREGSDGATDAHAGGSRG
ncbi:MAG TPA: hypothetical protein VGC54_06960 [Planctomycetota bacterium]